MSTTHHKLIFFRLTGIPKVEKVDLLLQPLGVFEVEAEILDEAFDLDEGIGCCLPAAETLLLAALALRMDNFPAFADIGSLASHFPPAEAVNHGRREHVSLQFALDQRHPVGKILI
jgi:hypothetical protein